MCVSWQSPMSQAEVPLEWIHAFYWEMGSFICHVFIEINYAFFHGSRSFGQIRQIWQILSKLKII